MSAPPYRKGDRVATTGAGKTAGWPGVTGTVAQVLTSTSVEVYFDGAAFGHEMRLEEIRPLPDLYYARLDRPQQIALGSMGGRALYAACAGCGEEAAVIHGCIRDRNGQTAVLPVNGGVIFQLAYFCEGCFTQRLGDGPDLSPAEGALAFPQHPLLL